ncbi:MAG: hypothetical protein L6Q98_09225 [Anaerolineae bacterium]|nr:hypothetical protein [Anaerolineae bacterium]NUQ06230.1 hypothetical protein [Anaerolineae bacterium]
MIQRSLDRIRRTFYDEETALIALGLAAAALIYALVLASAAQHPVITVLNVGF